MERTDQPYEEWVEAAYTVANLIYSGPEGIVERILKDHSNLLNVLMQAMLRAKKNFQLVVRIIHSMDRLGSLGDRN